MKFLVYFFKRVNKRFSMGLSRHSGRNLLGKICVYGRGGGNKFLYRNVDFIRRINSYGKILQLIKDINYRSGFIGLVLYDFGLSSFILLSEHLLIDDRIYSGDMHNVIIDKHIDNG
jgi:large subunit ribosomal protein L2